MTLDCRGSEMKLVFSLILIYFLLVPAYANEPEYVQMCFNGQNTAAKAYKEISFLKAKSDKLNLVNECIDLYVAKNRVELFIKFTRMKFPYVKVLELSSKISNRQCEFEVREEMEANFVRSNIGIKPRNGVNLREKKAKNISSKISKMVLTEGLPGSINYKGHKILITCAVKRNGIEIKFTYTSKEFSINSARYINRNQEIELGSFNENTDDTQNTKSIGNGIGATSMKKDKAYKLYIKAK